MTNRVELDISELAAGFPTYRVALVVAAGLRIPEERPPALEALMAESERKISASVADLDLATVPEIRSWREAYKAFGVKKTSYRSSVERLLKNLQRGAGLPRVNPLVDLYNAVSTLHRMPIGADDLDKIKSPLAFRYSRTGDSFVALGDAAMSPDPPKPGEVVYADAEKCLCRRWNWYQDARSAVGPSTRRAVLTIQTLTADAAELQQAADRLAAAIVDAAGGRAGSAIADAARPKILVDLE